MSVKHEKKTTCRVATGVVGDAKTYNCHPFFETNFTAVSNIFFKVSRRKSLTDWLVRASPGPTLTLGLETFSKYTILTYLCDILVC